MNFLSIFASILIHYAQIAYFAYGKKDYSCSFSAIGILAHAFKDIPARLPAENS